MAPSYSFVCDVEKSTLEKMGAVRVGGSVEEKCLLWGNHANQIPPHNVACRLCVCVCVCVCVCGVQCVCDGIRVIHRKNNSGLW